MISGIFVDKATSTVKYNEICKYLFAAGTENLTVHNNIQNQWNEAQSFSMRLSLSFVSSFFKTPLDL